MRVARFDDFRKIIEMSGRSCQLFSLEADGSCCVTAVERAPHVQEVVGSNPPSDGLFSSYFSFEISE